MTGRSILPSNRPRTTMREFRWAGYDTKTLPASREVIPVAPRSFDSGEMDEASGCRLGALFLLWTGLVGIDSAADRARCRLAGVLRTGKKGDWHALAPKSDQQLLPDSAQPGRRGARGVLHAPEKWQLGTAEDDNGLLILVAG